MADMRNRTPFYGAVPTSKLNADHVFMADGSTLQEQADKEFELIEEITLTEAVNLIERTTEPDTTPYKFEAIIICSELPNTSAVAVRGNYIVNDNFSYGVNNTVSANATRVNQVMLENNKGYFMFTAKGGSTSTAPATMTSTPSLYKAEIIEKLSITVSSDAFPADSKFYIYAVRA